MESELYLCRKRIKLLNFLQWCFFKKSNDMKMRSFKRDYIFVTHYFPSLKLLNQNTNFHFLTQKQVI